jgi:hypothetical protein
LASSWVGRRDGVGLGFDIFEGEEVGKRDDVGVGRSVDVKTGESVGYCEGCRVVGCIEGNAD